MEKIIFKVAEYDAPLALILDLIRMHKLDIVNINISSLLEQYTAVIKSWEESSIEVASEFLEMASRLLYMKTVSLLPKHEEESEKLKEELKGELTQYSLCKIAAQMLREKDISPYIFVREPMKIELDQTYNMFHDRVILFSALLDAQGKGTRKLPPPRKTFDPIVSAPVISVNTKIFNILRGLRQKHNLNFKSLFEPERGRSDMVATFLAVLELVKSKQIVLINDVIKINGSKKDEA